MVVSTGHSLWSMLRSSRVLRSRLFNMGFQWFSVTLSYYGLSFASTRLSDDIFTNFILRYLSRLKSKILHLTQTFQHRSGNTRLHFLSLHHQHLGEETTVVNVPGGIRSLLYNWQGTLILLERTCKILSLKVLFSTRAKLHMCQNPDQFCLSLASFVLLQHLLSFICSLLSFSQPAQEIKGRLHFFTFILQKGSKTKSRR